MRMSKFPTQSERLLNWSLFLVIALCIGIGGWIAYRLYVASAASPMTLRSENTDLRGQPTPDLILLRNSGNQSVIDALNEETTILAFLMTNCPACNAARPILDELAERQDTGIVGIFAESDESVENYSTRFTKFNDPERQLFNVFDANSVPAIYILEGGVVRQQTAGWSPAVGRALSQHFENHD